jgi:signal transduction histidine kinase
LHADGSDRTTERLSDLRVVIDNDDGRVFGHRLRLLRWRTATNGDRADLDSGHLKILGSAKEALSAVAVAADACTRFAARASLRTGTLLQTQLAHGLPLVPGDRVQLQQVMLNLILNAVEAMRESDDGSRELLISTEADGANCVRIAVRDWGPGLEPESLDRLFDAFYTTKPDGMVTVTKTLRCHR